jgi:cytoskeletal protein CcmA (bactofilin family)
MWSKQPTLSENPAPSNAQSSASSANPSRLAISGSRSSARLGSSIHIKGEVIGSEDLQIDGIVEGPVSLDGHVLTIGSTAQLNSEVHADEIVVCGKVLGNVHARGRVEIAKDGSITGDIACARISIEDGAHFKGRIEIDPERSKHSAH